jgi:hypothetical protein
MVAIPAGVTAEDRRLVEAGDPGAMRRFLEALAQEHAISIEWTADSDKWFARVASRFVSIPPPIDRVAFAIGLHEECHVIGGPCRGSDHQGTIKGRVHQCLACENRTWFLSRALTNFDREMFEAARGYLGTYRRRIPAPTAAKQAADRLMGFVPWALEESQRRRWQWMLDRNARAREAAARTSLSMARWREKETMLERWKRYDERAR